MISELFGARYGTILGVQAKSTELFTTVAVTGVRFRGNGIGESRHAVVSLFLDGDEYDLNVQFSDETLENRDFRGRRKVKNSDVLSPSIPGVAR